MRIISFMTLAIVALWANMASAATVIWDESIDGDLLALGEGGPTQINSVVGDNIIRGNVANIDDPDGFAGYIDSDRFKLNLAAGQTVTPEGKMVGFAVAMPSLSRALQKSRGRLFPLGVFHLLKAMYKNDLVDLYLIAIRPDYQGKALNAILIHEIWKIFTKHKIRWAETNVELEENVKVRSQWDYFENRQHKRRRCFIKAI